MEEAAGTGARQVVDALEAVVSLVPRDIIPIEKDREDARPFSSL